MASSSGVTGGTEPAWAGTSFCHHLPLGGTGRRVKGVGGGGGRVDHTLGIHTVGVGWEAGCSSPGWWVWADRGSWRMVEGEPTS